MEELRRYEGMIIVDPSSQIKGFNDSIKRIENFIKENGGSLIYTEKVGLTSLAYTIRRNNKGYYFYFEFTLAPSQITGLNTLFLRDEQIIRNIVVALDKHGIEYNDSERKKKETVKKAIALVKEEKKKNKFIDATKKMYCRFKRFGVKYIDYKNITFLYKFINPQGKILPRRLTGNSLKYQKKVAQAIKRARHLAILPFVSDNLK